MGFIDRLNELNQIIDKEKLSQQIVKEPEITQPVNIPVENTSQSINTPQAGFFQRQINKIDSIEEKAIIPNLSPARGILKALDNIAQAPKIAKDIGAETQEKFEEADTKLQKTLVLGLGTAKAAFHAIGTATGVIPAFEGVRGTVPELEEVTDKGWEGLVKLSSFSAKKSVDGYEAVTGQEVSQDTKEIVGEYFETFGPMAVLGLFTGVGLRSKRFTSAETKAIMTEGLNNYVKSKGKNIPVELTENIVNSLNRDVINNTRVVLNKTIEQPKNVPQSLLESVNGNRATMVEIMNESYGKLPNIVMEGGKPPKTPFNTPFEKIKTAVHSDLMPLKKLQKLAKQRNLETSIYEQSRVAQSSGGGRSLNAIRRKETAIKEIARDNIKPEDVGKLLVYKRQPALKAKGKTKGVNVKQAELEISKLKQKYGEEKFALMEDYTNYFYSEFTAARKRLVETGRISKEFAEKLVAEDPFYVSYSRDVLSGELGRAGRGKSPIKKLSKQGSELDIINPIVSFDDVVTSMYQAAESNLKLSQLPDLAKAMPEYIFETTPKKKLGKQPKSLSAEGLVSEKTYIEKLPIKNENTVVYYDKGVPRTFEMVPELAKAFNGNKTFLSGNHAVLNVFRAGRDLLRTTATGLNPVFQLVTNPLKDFVSQKILTAKSTGGASWKEIRSARKGIKDWQNGVNSAGAKEFQQALNEGALITPKHSEFNIKVSKKVKQLELRGKGEFSAYVLDPLTAGKELISIMQDIGFRSENGTRFANWQKAKQQGKGPIERALISRDSSVDFMTKGTVFAEINDVVAFFNAAYQGSANIIGKGVTSPKATSLALAKTMMLPSAAITMYNLQFAEDEYKQFLKERPGINGLYWVIAIPDSKKVLTIPKPWTYGAVGMMTESIVDNLVTGEEVNWKMIGENFINGLSPTDDIIPIPSIAKPIVDVWRNKTWYGAPIQPTFIDESKAPDPKNRYFLQRPPKEVYLKIAEMLDSAADSTGQNWLKASPAAIEYGVESYTAAVGKLFGQTLDTIESAFDGEFDFTQTPLSSAFVKERSDKFPRETDEQKRIKNKVLDFYIRYLNTKRTKEGEEALLNEFEQFTTQEQQVFSDYKSGNTYIAPEDYEKVLSIQQDIYNDKFDIRRDTEKKSKQILDLVKKEKVDEALELLKTMSNEEVQYGYEYWKKKLR